MRRALVLAVLLACCKGDDEATPPGNDAGVDIDDFVKGLPASCAFDCKNGCPAERVGPFACPAMGRWDQIPHDSACGSPTPPAATKGKCEIGPATGEALARASKTVLPDGHRITPAGRELELVDDTHVGGFPVSIAVATPKYGVIVEAGFGDHLVRSIDLDSLTVVSTVRVERASWGPAIVPLTGSHRVLVSGGASGKIWSLTLDDASGKLTLDATPIDLGSFFSAGLAVTPDGKRLLATGARSTDLKIVSLETAEFGKTVASASLGNEQFGVFIDPADTAGESAWVTMWEDSKVVAVDARDGSIKRSVNTGKNPESIAFLDTRYMVVSAADGDSLTVIDRIAGSVVSTISIEKGTHGWSPTALTYDAASKRLYVAEAIINAIEVFDVTLGGTPVLASRGRIPTAWWPTDLALASGKLYVAEGRGHGTGTGRTMKHFGAGEGEIAESMRGTLRELDLATIDLTKASAEVAKNLALHATAGYPQPSCTDDFPIPVNNTSGPSQQIKHIVLVVRENKTFDGLLGDLPGVDGDAAKALVPGKMDFIIPNFRAIGKKWTVADNYYTDAEFSSQGHVWTTYGRTSDFTERVWHIAASGKGRDLGGGVTDVGRPEEGSVFEWLLRLNVEQDILGEATGLPPPPKDKRNPLDKTYPGLAQNVGLEDVTKACYFAARARSRCDLHDFVYITFPNDHTFGGGGNRPTPETMLAVNDEATGMLVEALSASPFWASTLVIVTEDDPQDGGDHVDLHRTPIVFAGPWVKRGYVAKGHYDVASLIKLLAHVRGLPYPNEVVARAPLPLEMFTSTPDYTGWKTIPRGLERACNATGSMFATEAAMWDWDEIDEQPGLGRHLRKMLVATPAERGQ
jgi:DNA-binding beta-propeller fold protein YncE